MNQYRVLVEMTVSYVTLFVFCMCIHMYVCTYMYILYIPDSINFWQGKILRKCIDLSKFSHQIFAYTSYIGINNVVPATVSSILIFICHFFFMPIRQYFPYQNLYQMIYYTYCMTSIYFTWYNRPFSRKKQGIRLSV